MILGTIEARKNHLMLLQVWAKIVERVGARAPRLLVIGQRGWECEQVVDLLDRSELLKGSVIEIKIAVTRCSQTIWQLHARCCLPSLVEGYGLPLVEAGLRSGTPAIASDLPVFREIVGDIPEYLDRIDGPSWDCAIMDYSANGSSRRKAQVKRMAGFRAPAGTIISKQCAPGFRPFEAPPLRKGDR